jgi:hypothetical protein
MGTDVDYAYARLAIGEKFSQKKHRLRCITTVGTFGGKEISNV